MPLPVPAELESALAANPAARSRFDRLPPETKDAWISWVQRARSPRGRGRRIEHLLGRLAPPAATAAAVEETGPPPLPPRRPWWPWLLALALLLVVAGLLVWLLVYRNDDNGKNNVVVQQGAVPAVVGMKQAAAAQAVKQAGLTPSVTKRESDSPAGIVIVQRPEAGKVVKDGAVVTLIVSRGPPPVAAPDVTGLAAADAVAKLQEAKLVPRLVEVKSTETPGTVVAQNPPAGTKLPPGSRVTLRVSRGAGKVTVPAVTGESVADATAELQAAGFKPQARTVPSDQPRDTVIAQAPRGGEAAVKGSTVRLDVSRGPAATTTAATTSTAPTSTSATTRPATTVTVGAAVPRLTSQGIVTALGQLERAGFLARVSYETGQAPLGRVLEQEPPAGTRVASRTRVQLVVSEGPNPGDPTPVPDVTGQDEASARTTLEDAGFRVAVIQASVPRGGGAQAPGTIVEQQPAAGMSISAGDFVAIYVAR